MKFKAAGWRISGAGQVHPTVVRNSAHPSATSASLRSGLERLTMLRHGIDDLRLFFRWRPALPRAVRMKFSESWLRSFCNPSLSATELADRLTMAGVEVESCEPAGPPQLAGVGGRRDHLGQASPQCRQADCLRSKDRKETLQVGMRGAQRALGMKAPLAASAPRI